MCEMLGCDPKAVDLVGNVPLSYFARQLNVCYAGGYVQHLNGYH